MRQKFVLTGLAALIAIALACASDSTAPLSPTGDASGTNAETETLKVTAPTVVSPVNDQQPSLLVLNASPSEGKFTEAGSLQYNFEIYDSANVRVVNDIAPSSSHTVAALLEFGKRYTWRVRATRDGAYGPFSTTGSFIAPAGGYNTVADGLYDPLINGRTIGTVHGNVEFIPGVGAKLLDNSAYISWELPATIEDGEISAVVTNICSCSGQEGTKTKVFGMMQGYDDITTNERRFTVEKRSNADKGKIAWRILQNGGDADTVGEERMFVDFQFPESYLFQAKYGNGIGFNLSIDHLGDRGNIYNFGKGVDGFYDPSPHVVFVGSPPPRAGPDSGSVANMIIRHLYVSGRPRPAALNQ
jgi:hypothetical protein